MNYNVELSLHSSILREPDVVDEFYTELSSPSDDGKESVSYVDPLYMLFNQERLNSLGEYGVKKFLEQFSQKEDSLKELRSRVSDDDLVAMIKSRHLQSPSEITAWCRYIESNIDAFNKELQNLMQQQQSATDLSVKSDVESTKTD